MADFLTFANLYTELSRLLKTPKGSKRDLEKAIINQVYLNEIMVCDPVSPLYWMVDFDDTLKSVAPATIIAISTANPGVVTTAAVHGFVVGDLVTHHDIVGMTELNDRIQQISATPTTSSYSFGENTGLYTPWSSGGTTHHRGKTFSTRVQKMLAAGWHGYTPPMREIDYIGIENNSTYHYNNTKGRPVKYYHGKGYSNAGAEVNQIIWHPGADAAYILRYWYEARASKLVNDADVPLLPPQFHYAILAGAATRLAEYKVQVENAVIWPSIYKAQIKAIQDFNRNMWKTKDPTLKMSFSL